MENSQDLRDIIFYRRQEEGYSPILVFLILQTAAIKFTLNENFRIYTAELESTLPNFRPILTSFMEKYPVILPTPKNINSIFKQVLESRELVDYEGLVDNIMHICPKYRIGDQDEEDSCDLNKNTKKSSLNPSLLPTGRPMALCFWRWRASMRRSNHRSGDPRR